MPQAEKSRNDVHWFKTWFVRGSRGVQAERKRSLHKIEEEVGVHTVTLQTLTENA